MEYNTQRERIPMPEYGRSVQEMVDYALTIEDRAERQRCAETIVNIMWGMYPSLRDVSGFQMKLWDHLAYMSGYRLDVDYPYEVTRLDNSRLMPDPIPYSGGDVRFRHYGRIVPELIGKAAELPEGEAKSMLVRLIASQMKKDLLTWNRETADNSRVVNDLLALSDGRLRIDAGELGTQSVPNSFTPRQGTRQQFQKRKNRKRY